MENPRRSIVKALSWRGVAVLVTAVVTWIITGSVHFVILIGGMDTVVKLVAYYLHERAWNRVDYGKLQEPEYHI